ncbi:hypothetical protein EU537_03975 [Candidatus Thorarchaeota archaeon]|nr:MAG: hypothetical protein EU537_03975 [Candidatus Thorarchaeota archaeon]
MQLTDPTLLPSFITAFIGFIVASYLFSLWYRQSARMYTDLPLMFSLSILGTGVNMLIHAIPIILQMESTLALFKIRSLAIGLSVIPMMGILLHIWLPKYTRWHVRFLVSIVLYWALVASVGPNQTSIILLTVPVLLIFTLGLIVTFAITWKTGRLKEVRSDLLVVSLLLAFATQALKVPFLLWGLDTMTYLLNVAMMILIAIALVNPWYHRIEATNEVTVQAVTY